MKQKYIYCGKVLAGLFVVVVGCFSPLQQVGATTGVDWTTLPSIMSSGVKFYGGSDSPVYGFAYGAGKYVAVGSSFSYSSDGITWTNAISPFGNNAMAVVYGGTKFVAVGEYGRAAYSTDGITWTNLPAGTDTGIKFGTSSTAYSIAYGGGKYVVVGASGKASYSTDGITWTYLTPGSDTGINFGANPAYSVAYGTDKFVVGGPSGYVSRSDDGITWTSMRVDPFVINVNVVSYGSGLFVALGSNGGMYSSDGISWTDMAARPSFTPNNNAIAAGGGKFVVVGSLGVAAYSTDGSTWTTLTAGVDTGIKFGTSNAYSVAYVNDKFIVGGRKGNTSYSSDGVTWTPNPDHNSGLKLDTARTTYDYYNYAYSVAYGAGTFVTVGDNGSASYSTDGISWTALTAGSDSGIKFGTDGNANSVAYGNGKFVTVGTSGKASYSADGISWTSLTPGADTGIKFGTTSAISVTYGGGKFVVVGASGKASYSADGITWTSLTAGDDTGIKFGTTTVVSVTYGKGMFVAVGSSGKASYSTDGITWTVLTPGTDTGIMFGTTNAQFVNYAGGKFIVGGESGKASYSADGITWTSLPAGADTGIKFGTTTPYSVSYGGGTYVIVGASGKASYSTNGITWTALTAGYETGIKFGTLSVARSIVNGVGKLLAVGNFGAASYTLAANDAPIIDTDPSDGGSSSATPTTIGAAVSFSATALDPGSDNYYLAVCKTDAITANNNAAPACGGGNWCVSTSTVSGEAASCDYTTTTSDVASNAWYAFVCDHSSGSLCSASSQGTGDTGSTFNINIPVAAPAAASASISTPAKAQTKEVTVESAMLNAKTNVRTLSLTSDGSMRFNTRVSDPDQLKKITIRIGGKTIELKNEKKKNVSMFSAVLDQLKDQTGKFNYTVTADYGTTQVRDKGVINIVAKKDSTVPIAEVNKNFREVFGRTPTFKEWTKWATEVSKGVTKQQLQTKLKAGR